MDYVQPRDVAAVKADKHVVVLDVPSLASFAYQLNHTKPPFSNKALRHALACAMGVEQIVTGVWLNVGVPSNGPIPPTSWAYDTTLKPIRRDLAKAKAKLAEGGQPSGFAFTTTTANIPINVQEAEVLQAQLAEAGITMKIKLVDASTQLADGNRQCAAWVGRLLRGDLGRSIRNQEPVIENVSRRIRPSLQLALLARAISLLLAVPIAIASAVRRNSRVDRVGTSFALVGICMPNFLLALILIFLFGVTLRWLPISGYTDPFEEPLRGLRSLTLPAATLGLALAAVIMRTLRSSLLEALAEDYVRTARAKGLSEWRVIRGHALKNALLPVVTVLGLQLGTLIGGAVITEYVFALPGVGRLVVDAVFARDYPLVQGVVLLIALGFILSNLVVDLLYGWIDPRIRYH